MSRVEKLIEKYSCIFENFPSEWKPFLTGVKETELCKMASVILNNRELIKFAPEPENWWNCFKDLSPQDVRVVLIGDCPNPHFDYTTKECKTDGLLCGTKRGFEINPETRLLFTSIARNLKLGLLGSNDKQDIYDKMFQQRTAENNWSLEGWKNQGVLMLNARHMTDNLKLSEIAIKFYLITEKILNNLISKSKSKPIILVYFGQDAQSKLCISKSALKKAPKVYIISTVSLGEACSNHKAFETFMNDRVFHRVNTFLCSFWDDYELFFV
jgi:uracil DNA glycosylase